MVIGIIALLTAITFISIALYSNTAAGDIDNDSNSNNDSDDDDESGGWASLLQDISEYLEYMDKWL